METEGKLTCHGCLTCRDQTSAKADVIQISEFLEPFCTQLNSANYAQITNRNLSYVVSPILGTRTLLNARWSSHYKLHNELNAQLQRRWPPQSRAASSCHWQD